MSLSLLLLLINPSPCIETPDPLILINPNIWPYITVGILNIKGVGGFHIRGRGVTVFQQCWAMPQFQVLLWVWGLVWGVICVLLGAQDQDPCVFGHIRLSHEYAWNLGPGY